MAIVLRSATRPIGPGSARRHRCAARAAPPICAKTVSTARPPAGARSAARATCTGVSPSCRQRAGARRGARCRRSVSSGRPCRVSVAQSASGQPSRAAARLKALGCGRIAISSGGKCRVKTARRRRTSRVAARQHDDALAAPRRDRLDRRGAAAGARRCARRAPAGTMREMARAADQHLARSRPARAPPATSPASPSSPMPTTDEPGNSSTSLAQQAR